MGYKNIWKRITPLVFALSSLGISSADAQEFSVGFNDLGFDNKDRMKFSIEQRMFEKDTEEAGFRWGGYFSISTDRFYKKSKNRYLGSAGLAGKVDFGDERNPDLVFSLGPAFSKNSGSKGPVYDYGFRAGAGVGLPLPNDNKVGVDFFYGYIPKNYSLLGLGLSYKFDFEDLLE